ncbi:MAG: division plane positioning ATPase MipZ [Planctomycetota bacterium]
MSQVVRVIVVNTDEDAQAELRGFLLGIEGVKIVAEVDEPALLTQALDQFPAEALLIHLDPNPAAIMDAVTPLIEKHKDQIAAIAMSEDRNAELVVRAMRAGMREFLWKPFPPDQLGEILRRVGGKTGGIARRLGQLIPVVGTCGGVGVTALVTNLAVELAQLKEWNSGAMRGGPRVAAVDLDLRFGQVAMFLDARATYTIADLCDTPERIEPQMIERVMVKHSSGVHVLAQPNDLERAERITAAQAAGALSALQEHYDFVVVDGPVRFDPTARAVLDMTDMCLMVLQLIVPSVRNADRILAEMGRSGYNLDRVALVCNRYGRDAGYLERSDVETTLGRKLTWLLPDDWRTSSSAVNVGTPLSEWAPKSKLRAGYQQIALALANYATRGDAGPVIGVGADETQKKGLFSLFAGQK